MFYWIFIGSLYWIKLATIRKGQSHDFYILDLTKYIFDVYFMLS